MASKKFRCVWVVIGTAIRLSNFIFNFCSILNANFDIFSLFMLSVTCLHFFVRLCRLILPGTISFAKFILLWSVLSFWFHKGVSNSCTLDLNRCKISFFVGNSSENEETDEPETFVRTLSTPFVHSVFSIFCCEEMAILTVCFLSCSFGFSFAFSFTLPGCFEGEDNCFKRDFNRWSVRKLIRGMFSMSNSLQLTEYSKLTFVCIRSFTQILLDLNCLSHELSTCFLRFGAEFFR